MACPHGWRGGGPSVVSPIVHRNIMLQCTMSSHPAVKDGVSDGVNPNPKSLSREQSWAMGFGSPICLKKSERIPSGQGLMGQTEPPNPLPSFAGDADLARLAREGAALVLVAANGTDVLWATPAGAAIIDAHSKCVANICCC